MTVYTDYGYGVVDADKFKAEVDRAIEAHTQAKKLILEYFSEQHALLIVKQTEEEE